MASKWSSCGDGGDVAVVVVVVVIVVLVVRGEEGIGITFLKIKPSDPIL